MIEIPGWRAWVFSLKTFGAAIMALYLAMWFNLPHPYWALTTVYITSQVFAGATRSKALFRVLGTLLGAVMSIILVPNLINAPPLLAVAMAAWVGLCLYLSLLDRTPRSYVLMLAGYTIGIIGFPSVEAPDAIFENAVARLEEISLGILCASLVSLTVFPQSVLPLISARLDSWIKSARSWLIDIFERTGPSFDSQTERLRLASDAIAFDALTTSLRHEMSGFKGGEKAMATLRQHMLMFLPIASSMSDRIGALEKSDNLDDRVKSLLTDASWWLRSDLTDPILANQLQQRAVALEPKLGPKSSWADLLTTSLLLRFREFVDLRQDMRELQYVVRDGRQIKRPIAFSYTARAKSIRHRDHGMALLSAIGAFLSIIITCAIWIATGWPYGSTAPMITAVACSFFATFDDPAPYILTFANAAIVGAICAGIYLFGILPLATSFEMLALALAPLLIACGLFMTQPRTAVFAIGVAVNGCSMLAIQNDPTSNFVSFADSAIAMMVGIWTAVITVRLVRSVGAAWNAHRLRRLNRESLARSAMHVGENHGLELAALMLDRVGLIAPRLAAMPPEDAEATADLLSEVRSGINLVELRRVRNKLPLEAERSVETVLVSIAHYFKSGANHAGVEELKSIDTALRTLLGHQQTHNIHEAIMGLVGLRQSLFPNAPGFAPIAHAERTP